MNSEPGAEWAPACGTSSAQGRGGAADGRNSPARRVMMSPVVGGGVRTWSRSGSRLWSVDRPEELAAQVLCAEPYRYPLAGGRSTVGAFVARGALWVPARATGSRHGSGRAASMRYRLTAADPSPPEADEADRLRGEMFNYLSVAVRLAALAGEPLLIGPGGWDVPEQPSCVIGVYDDGAGPRAVVEARPAPIGGRLWRGIPEGAPTAAITAPARLDKLPGAALYAIDALRCWNLSPWDVVLTYGRYRGNLRRTDDGVVYPSRDAAAGAASP